MTRKSVLILVALLAALIGATAARAAYPPLNVYVDTDHTPGPAVPRDFLGLSYEAGALPTIARFANEGNLVTYLKSLGPGSLRFGGVTVDTQAAWSDGGGTMPAWAVTPITAPDMTNLGQLARAANWTVLLGVGLGHYDPDAASREVAAASASLGSRLAGVEIGNEPHSFATKDLRQFPWGFPQYQPEVDAYRSAIDARTLGVPLVGPDVGSGSSSWLWGEALAERPSILTVHYYSLGCHRAPPAVNDLLSSRVRAIEKSTFWNFARISRDNWLPLRIGETNNVSCGGRAGVSETFASALWAVDFAARAMANGLAGVNFHGSIFNCQGYTPLCARSRDDLAAGRLTANPEWYALLMLHQLVGDRPLTAWMSPLHRNVTVSAWAASRGRMHVLLIDDGQPGSSSLAVRLKLPAAFRSGTILRLSAPDPSATGGVTLGGQSVDATGVWSPPASPPRLVGSPGKLTLRLAPASAALVTLYSHR